MTEPIHVTLDNLNDGAAGELFLDALGRVLANIDDPNTAAKAKRRIVLTVDFIPRDDRRSTEVLLGVTTKLAPIAPVSAMALLGRHKGALVIAEAPRNEDMFPDAVGRPQSMVAKGASE